MTSCTINTFPNKDITVVTKWIRGLARHFYWGEGGVLTQNGAPTFVMMPPAARTNYTAIMLGRLCNFDAPSANTHDS